MKEHWRCSFLLLCLWIPVMFGSPNRCSRHKSRIVRKIIEQELLSLYTDFEAAMPQECPLSFTADMYALQEQRKLEDTSSKWICQFCGKAFYEEHFLDMHFENRHASYIRQGSSVVCLADLCHVFRCDVVSGQSVPEYWDRALCHERMLQRHRAECMDVMQKCTPKLTDSSRQRQFSEALSHLVCDFLTCDKYWEPREFEMNPLHTLVYIIAVFVLVFALLVYYTIAYSHFYTDDSLLTLVGYSEGDRPKILLPPTQQKLRYRVVR
ncbi:hypothetical protein LSAT2_030364 [Lamellibrachia satsuma]|nr:hypothetical protein LSAT2_030364 [Lamellibrachia satsuma]